MVSVIYIKGTKYFYYDTYTKPQEAYNTGKYYKKKNRSKYYVMKILDGKVFPRTRWRLYMTKVWRLFG